MNTTKSKHIYATGIGHSTTGAKGICADIKRLRGAARLRSPFRFCGRTFSTPKPVASIFILCALCVSVANAAPRPAPEIAEAKALRAIIGEAANQGQVGMHAVASAIRNRGTLKGVYGLNNPIAASPSPIALSRASRAWASSATNDITLGATHWDNTKAFGTPYWARDMIVTTNIGSHTFYRAQRK